MKRDFRLVSVREYGRGFGLIIAYSGGNSWSWEGRIGKSNKVGRHSLRLRVGLWRCREIVLSWNVMIERFSGAQQDA